MIQCIPPIRKVKANASRGEQKALAVCLLQQVGTVSLAC